MLAPGTRLGVCEVIAAIGAGGMGEVYRARDTKLGRDVALKVLPESLARDPERVARMHREAQVLAALNHPNIAAIHGFEDGGAVHALVLEFVDGETLADRIARGPIPLDEALPIAKQIAEALETAHEQGIIHRDLKPANIKVRPDGAVKVLDFGLAKLTESNASAPSGPNALSMSPTITSPALVSGIGVLLGTAGYMSPEQAKGREADKRSDVWAFGAVLFEMLTGRRAFEGEDIGDTLATVLKSDPDWNLLPDQVPPALRTLLCRCLTKDRRQRPSEIAVATFIVAELDHLAPAPTPVAIPARPRWRPWSPTAAALAAIIVGAGAWALRPIPSPPGIAYFSFALPPGQSFSGTTRQLVAISPDGSRLAYVANGRIYLRSIGDLEPHAIPGTEERSNVINPMFAPDGASVAFFEQPSNDLKRISIGGGTASTLTRGLGLPCGATWGPTGILIAEAYGDRGILRVPSNGGVPERVVRVAAGEQACGPQMLPDGETVVFTLAQASNDNAWDEADVVAQSLADGTRRVLIKGGSDARYLRSGHLLYAVAGAMYAVPFDAERLTITNSAVPVVEGVRRSTPGQTTSATHLAVSDTGTLAYVPGSATTSTTMFDLVLGDGRSDPTALKVPPAVYVSPRVSADGRVLAVGRSDAKDTDIWLYDLAAKTDLRRFTFGGNNAFPVWSSDGRRITFQSVREGDKAIWWQPVDGGKAERLTTAKDGEEHVPLSWSRDGRYLLFCVSKGLTFAPSARIGSTSLWVFTVDGKKMEPFGTAQPGRSIRDANFSPDGRWVAYAVAAGGPNARDGGVFVEPFPATSEKHQAPRTQGGRDYHPVWAPDGKSLFYVPDSNFPIVSVPVVTSPGFAFGTPEEMTRAPRPGLQSWQPRGYDVLPDGRFVSVSLAPGAPEVRIILNWFEELKRLVPTK
jgi:serine/threonine-protein kinase